MIVAFLTVFGYLVADIFSVRADPAAGAETLGPAAGFSVKDFGVIGDGRAKDTQAIQQAIDAAHRAGGGTVYFPPGKYLSGTLYLKNSVTLYLEEGSVILGSTEIADFPEIVSKFRSYTDNYVTQSLIYAEDRHDIAITGSGTIDGQGAAYPDRSYLGRPYVIRFVECRHILVEGIRLRNSPMWMQHYLACDFVTIRGIHVYNHCTYNNDMIDIDCCRNVHISDCYGNSDDDALTLKSTADRPTENVTITNCVLGSRCNAIKMGTESNGGFKNIAITNCVINSKYEKKGFYGGLTGSSGISLELVDGGTLENITISNISMKNVKVPIFLRLGNRARPFKKEMEKPGMGSFRNVVLSNIIATEVGEVGCSITGLPGHPIENVSLSNIRITFPGGGTAADAERQIPELAEKYPEGTMFGTLPAYGFFCRHVDGLRFSNIDIEAQQPEHRPAVLCDDVLNLEVAGFSEEKSGSGSPAMFVLKDVSQAAFRACRPAAGSRTFLRLEGKTARVSVFGNDLSRVISPFEFGESVPESAIFQAANKLRQ